jgi:hypothetical protein
MTRLLDRLRAGGRKYAVVLYTLELGALLSLVALLVSVLNPGIAAQAATIVNAFGILGGLAVAAYQGANAAADWNATPKPAARQSGMVQVSDADAS